MTRTTIDSATTFLNSMWLPLVVAAVLHSKSYGNMTNNHPVQYRTPPTALDQQQHFSMT